MNNNPIALSTPQRRRGRRRKTYTHLVNDDFTMSYDDKEKEEEEEDEYDYDDDDYYGNIANFSSSSILLPHPFTYSQEKMTTKKNEEEDKDVKKKITTTTNLNTTTTAAAAAATITKIIPPPTPRRVVIREEIPITTTSSSSSSIFKDKPHPSNYHFSPFSLKRNNNDNTRPKNGNNDGIDDDDDDDEDYDEDYTAEDDPSLWWDNKDIEYLNYKKAKKKKKRKRIITNATSINFVIDENLIRLYNTRCIIHEINLSAFQDLCAVFENYYSAIISSLDVAEKTFFDMLQTIYSNFARVQPPRNYHYSSIFSYISQITAKLFTRRCIIELSRLLAVRDYIINAENYINFHSKCLLDCYYQITRAFDFNLHKNALSQLKNQSQYSDYLQNCITKYAERSNNILIKIKNGS